MRRPNDYVLQLLDALVTDHQQTVHVLRSQVDAGTAREKTVQVRFPTSLLKVASAESAEGPTTAAESEDRCGGPKRTPTRLPTAVAGAADSFA